MVVDQSIRSKISKYLRVKHIKKYIYGIRTKKKIGRVGPEKRNTIRAISVITIICNKR